MDLALTDVALATPKRTLLQGLSIKVQAGQFWCVLGRNGAGKSTLLRTLCGLRSPAAGQILFNGRHLASYTPKEQARLRAYLPQHVSDRFAATVLDAVLTGRYPYHLAGAARFGFEDPQERRAAQDALAYCGLLDLATRDVRSLSGGERRRVALATVFAQEAPLMLLDEPSAHLDVDVEAKAFGLLREQVTRGNAIIASVHSPNLAMQYATHALLLLPQGTTLAGPRDEILTEKSVSEVFAHSMREVAHGGKRWFLPA